MNNNRHLCVFPITETEQTQTPEGELTVKQRTVGGFTKLEQGAFLIAQGLSQSGVVGEDDIARISIKVSNAIFDLLEGKKDYEPTKWDTMQMKIIRREV